MSTKYLTLAGEQGCFLIQNENENGAVQQTMTTTHIKICGVTRLQDALYAESLGINALGFNFVARSKRCIAIDLARDISLQLGPMITRVGLFLDDDPALVTRAIDAIPELHPQFHGTEDGNYCEQFNRPYIKCIGVGAGMPDVQFLSQYVSTSAFLFDSNVSGELGGTGHTFDWRNIQNFTGKRLILAGGLNPDNVADGIRQVRPYAVDVSSGVEQAPGIKDPDLVLRFVAAVRQSAQ